MKHLNDFKYFLKENIDSVEWDIEDIEEFCENLKDLGSDIKISPKKTILKGEYEGREITTIRIFLNNFKKIGIQDEDDTGLDYGTIYDDRIWDVLSEIKSLKKRLMSDKVFIHLTTAEIKISYLHNMVDNNNLDFKLEKLLSELKSRRTPTDFGKNILCWIDGDKIIVKCSSHYSKRKFDNYVNGIDLSDWDLNFEEEIIKSPMPNRLPDTLRCTITITSKNNK